VTGSRWLGDESQGRDRLVSAQVASALITLLPPFPLNPLFVSSHSSLLPKSPSTPPFHHHLHPPNIIIDHHYRYRYHHLPAERWYKTNRSIFCKFNSSSLRGNPASSPHPHLFHLQPFHHHSPGWHSHLRLPLIKVRTTVDTIMGSLSVNANWPCVRLWIVS